MVEAARDVPDADVDVAGSDAVDGVPDGAARREVDEQADTSSATAARAATSAPVRPRVRPVTTAPLVRARLGMRMAASFPRRG
ncbi:MAG TPA: hypothetical protein VEO01_33065 [Pseudonocardiaceae bacterium]|nr:hypothetical protein [Pseudonocardiaceae bacterium]